MKLNRKGFTLIELLAVIIILAIVVGITIPAIMTTVGNARESAFSSAAQTCANWIERQYQLYSVNANDTAINSTLKNKLGTTGSAQTLTAGEIEACGLKSTNVDASGTKFIISDSGRVCLLLKAATGKDYAGYGTFTETGAAAAANTKTNYTVGGACNSVTFPTN